MSPTMAEPTRTAPLKVGTIWYHPLAGKSRPFIVRRIEGDTCWSDNLDDGATDMQWPVAIIETMERL